MTDATVRLWGRDVAAVSWLADRGVAAFQYMPAFVESGVQLAPMTMPLSSAVRQFPELPRASFYGLPGLLADSLPDRFGNALINAWLAAQGRDSTSFNPVERLCYIGTRGMGALEFAPAILRGGTATQPVELDALRQLAADVLNDRRALVGELRGGDDRVALRQILRVGTSAGGARAKAVLAWNEHTGQFRSGQSESDEGFTQWILKFDGVANNRDKELADPQGFGRVEYACHLLALAAGVDMTPSRLHEEGGRAHFMTRRFDRDMQGRKLHMQSLAAMRHFDFNAAGAYSYEQAVETVVRLQLPAHDREQLVRRAFLNVLLRNQDDHVKNIAFLMNRAGEWRLAPAFDVTYAYNPQGLWTGRHQMTLAGKRDDFTVSDLLQFAAVAGIRRAAASRLLREMHAAVRRWPEFAEQAGVNGETMRTIHGALRLDLAPPSATVQ